MVENAYESLIRRAYQDFEPGDLDRSPVFSHPAQLGASHKSPSGMAGFMSPQKGCGRNRKQRHGVCHRCGWAGPVSNVGRADRKCMRTGRAFGRLCDDCVHDLLDQQSAGVGSHVPRRTGLHDDAGARVA
jgi:hypothetical protein